MKRRVMILDDDAHMQELLFDQLSAEGYEVATTSDPAAAIARVAAGSIDVLLTDLRMPGLSGIDICREVHQTRPDVPVIIMTAFGTWDAAVDAIRAGAHDFLSKPFELEQLILRLERALEHRHLAAEVRRLRRLTGDVPGFEGMIGTSPGMQRLYDLIERVGRAEVSVLILGESGTGKTLVARALHNVSRRKAAPFVSLNCAAVSEESLVAALFGCKVDASDARAGGLQETENGTVYLDEVGDLSAALQPRLLRALQERRPRHAGRGEVPTGARVIAATQHNLKERVDAGEFRQDLFYRLAVITVEVPPLREREDDIVLLAEVLAERAALREGRAPPALSEEAAECLRRYCWPGNVRELSNCMERCVALAEGEILANHLPSEIVATPAAPTKANTAGERPTFFPLFEVERRHILRVVDAVGGNKSQAARILGIDRKTLQARLARYGRS